MAYLILAVLCSTCITLVMRLSKEHVHNPMAMYMSNYAACSILGFLFMKGQLTGGEGLGFALGLGIFSGALYLVSLITMNVCIQSCGVTLASTFNKLGVIVTTAIAIFVFKEAFTINQGIGFLIAIAAIILMNFEKGEGGGLKPILLFTIFVQGLTDSVMNIFNQIGNPLLKNQFLVTIFFVAFLITGGILLIRRQKITAAEVLFGMMIGIPNYLSSRFLLASLATVPASIAYPIFCVATLVVLSLFGAFMFHEEINNRKKTAIVMILAALVLLNI